MSQVQEPTNSSPLREERLLRGWSQQELAERLGTTKLSVRRWEQGKTLPSAYFRVRLVSLLGKSLAALGLEQVEHPPLTTAQEETSQEPHILYPLDQEALSEHAHSVERSRSILASVSLKNPSRQRPHLFSRRQIIIGGVGGGCTLLLGSLAWRQFWSNKASFSSIPVFQPLYIYQAPPEIYLNDVSWSSSGMMIACAVGDSTVQIHQAITGSVSQVYNGHHGYVNCAQWQPLSTTLVASASSDTTVHIWNAQTGQRMVRYQGHHSSVLYLAWSHDGTRIASGEKNGMVQVWDASTGHHIQSYTGHKGRVWSISWAPTDATVVSAGEDGILHVWSPQPTSMFVPFVYQGSRLSTINEVAWSPQGKWIASGHADSTVSIWDASTGGHVLTYTGHHAGVRTVRWSPDAQYLASGGVDRTIQIWKAASGQRIALHDNDTDDILEVAWSPDGKYLSSVSKDGTLQTYRMHFS